MIYSTFVGLLFAKRMVSNMTAAMEATTLVIGVEFWISFLPPVHAASVHNLVTFHGSFNYFDSIKISTWH